MRKVIVEILLLFLGGCIFGCSLFNAHIKEFDLMRGMATDAAMRLQDGSVGQLQVSGQGLNPGIEVEAAIKYNATARYVGLAGQFGVSAQGKMGRQIDPQDILRIVNDTSLSDKERNILIAEIVKQVTTSRPSG